MTEIYQKRKKPLRVKLYSLLTGVSAVLLTVASGLNLQAQVSEYTFSQSSGSFNTIAATGTVVQGSEATTSTTNDTTGWTVSLPFTFNFNNSDYTSVYVNSNGAATFGTTIYNSTTAISATTAFDGAVAVMNRDLFGAFVTSGVTTSGSDMITNVVSMQGIEVGKVLATGSGIPANTTVTAFDEVAGTITMSNNATSSSATAVVRYGTGRVYTATEGTAPNRVFVIEWKGYNDYGTTAVLSNHLNFQLRLAESSNTVSVVYGPTYNISTTSRTNQVGLRGATNSDYNNRTGAVGNPWVNTSAGTANNATVARDNTNYPAAGLTFVWTPPSCYKPNSFSVSGQSPNSVTLDWTASSASSATSYTVYYSLVNTAPTSSTVLDASNSVTVSGLSATVTNLSPATTYYFWVRSNCSATDFSTWSATAVSGYTGYCIPATGSSTTRYIETLTTTGGMTNLNYSAGSYSPYVDQSATSFSTYPTGTVNYSIDASTTSNTYYYIWVDWNNDMDFEDAGEKVLGSTSMAVSTGSFTIPVTTALGSYRVRAAVATVSTIGACGTPANGNYVDFTLIVAAPTGCIAPSNLTVANETHNSAQVSWTASVTPPANGYEVYYSTSDVPPTASTVLDNTNSVTGIPTATYTAAISGLTPVTKYYFWVRSVCSGTTNSDWTMVSGSFSTLCQPPAITGTTGATVCNNTATLTATADAGATINWYADATATTPLATGTSFTTPVLSTTTNYYVSATTGSSSFVGPANPNALSVPALTTASNTYYIEFEVTNTPVQLTSVDVFPGAAGQSSTLEILSGPGTFAVVNTIPFTSTLASDGTIAQTVPINMSLSPGVYRMRLAGGSYYRNYQSNATFPYTATNFSITTGSNVASDSYYFMYNLQIGGSCESARIAVTATVDCTMGTSETEKNQEVTVYPNPFTDVINISEAKDLKSASVMDTSGRMVKSISNPGRQLNLSELKSGMYILKLDYKDGTSKTVKVIRK